MKTVFKKKPVATFVTGFFYALQKQLFAIKKPAN